MIPQRCAFDIPYRMSKEAKLFCLLPNTGFDILVVTHQVPSQGKHHRDNMFWNRIGCIASDIADGYSVLAAVAKIDIIGAGCGNGYHLQMR